MAGETIVALARRQEELLQRESTLQKRMDHMLNQRRVSLEQETERIRAEIPGAHHADFRAITNAALERFKKKWVTLELQIRDLEAELKKVTKSLMTHKYRGSQQSSREVKPKFIDSTQREPKNSYKP
jgi:hypothetical protein